ncbi:TPA: DUF2690 domain-containing protein [Enterobacter asburiae]|nr:DUF2690 domain-containing protein [Enterobacter asburiae]HCD7491861.1 DUF2690 domain-containing protein [Enterobacter asburiae]HEB5012886.1 DUF2690 domain-containing protein [Enterobacter asburiae]HEG1768805.1 DUF2690 domain-containing protein [Enterobacter asburiae]HEG2044965.1 DUF2690 domain-containing protein [Enterobacter asburiae]
MSARLAQQWKVVKAVDLRYSSQCSTAWQRSTSNCSCTSSAASTPFPQSSKPMPLHQTITMSMLISLRSPKRQGKELTRFLILVTQQQLPD